MRERDIVSKSLLLLTIMYSSYKDTLLTMYDDISFTDT